MPLAAHSLRDAPALIERLLPVQKLSVESYKEQMAVHGKTLTALGSYWKGRKPLILNKACVLGCLLPATGDDLADLEVFELLMAMDDASPPRPAGRQRQPQRGRAAARRPPTPSWCERPSGPRRSATRCSSPSGSG